MPWILRVGLVQRLRRLCRAARVRSATPIETCLSAQELFVRVDSRVWRYELRYGQYRGETAVIVTGHADADSARPTAAATGTTMNRRIYGEHIRRRVRVARQASLTWTTRKPSTGRSDSGRTSTTSRATSSGPSR